MGVNILNKSDNPAIVSQYVHELVDEGKMWFISYTFPAVAAGDTVYIHHTTGDTSHLHSTVNINTVGQWLFNSYANAVYSAIGTELSAINRRSDSDKVFKSKFYRDPTVTSPGNLRLNFTFGTGTTPSQATTGQFSENLESIFAPNRDVLIALTNQTNATQYISFVFNVYEQKLTNGGTDA